MRTLTLLVLTGSFACAAGADSLFTAEVAKQGTLASEKIARFEVGDIITVLVREEIEAATTANLRTKKESSVESEANAGGNQFLIAQRPDGLGLLTPELLPNWSIESEAETRVRGQTIRDNSLTTTISAIVKEVFENGNILLEGSKIITVNREDTRMFVSGIVRSRDVTPENTVLSTQMVNAVVRLDGKGPLWNNARRGLMTRFLDWFSFN